MKYFIYSAVIWILLFIGGYTYACYSAPDDYTPLWFIIPATINFIIALVKYARS